MNAPAPAPMNGDVLAVLVREVRQACERLGARVGADQPRPSWAWVCAQTLRVVQEYSMGTTIGILDSELQMAWSETSSSRGRGKLAALALEHRFDPLTQMLELEILEAPRVIPHKVDLLTARHTGTGECVQCILPVKLTALREDEPPMIDVGRKLRVSGCRMVRLPKPGQSAQRGDAPAYRADGDGVLTLLPTPHTSIVLGTGPGASTDIGDISSDDMLMMTFESELSALLGPNCSEISLNVRVVSIEPIQQDAGPRNPNVTKQAMRWRSVVLGDDESADTCHLRLSDDQVFVADHFRQGDYIGLHKPRVVSEASQGIHLEIDDERTILYIRQVADQHAESQVAEPQASANSPHAGATNGTSQFSGADGGMIRVLEIEAVPRLSQNRRGSICYEDDAVGWSAPPPSASQLLSPDDAAMRRQLKMRCEAVGNNECGGRHRGTVETAVVVVDYSARRDGFNDLSAELYAGQVLWINGLESMKPQSCRWGQSGAAAAEQRGAKANPEPWYFLQLPVDTAYALKPASARAAPADEKAIHGKLTIVSCTVGLLAAPWMQHPRSLKSCVQHHTQLAHCRATLTDIDISDCFGTLALSEAPPLATQFSQVRGTTKLCAAAAAGMKKFCESLRLTFDDGSTALCVSAHRSALEALWHLPLNELAQLSATDRQRRLSTTLGVTFDLLLSLVPFQPAATSFATAVGATASVQQQQQQQQQQRQQQSATDAVEYRLDGCARCSEAGLPARLRAQLNANA